MTWAIRQLGKDGASVTVVDPQHFAARQSQRPLELGGRGAYSIGLATGIIAAGLAANSELLQFRWVDATRVVIVRSVQISAAISTLGFVAGVPPTIELRKALSWSAQGTGGTGITFATNDSKKRTSFPQTLMAAGDLRIATTAALGAGTKTLDSNAYNVMVGNTAVATATTQIFPPSTILYDQDAARYPLHLIQNEGFVIRAVQTPGTGTWTLTALIEWDEVLPSETGW